MWIIKRLGTIILPKNLTIILNIIKLLFKFLYLNFFVCLNHYPNKVPSIVLVGMPLKCLLIYNCPTSPFFFYILFVEETGSFLSLHP